MAAQFLLAESSPQILDYGGVEPWCATAALPMGPSAPWRSQPSPPRTRSSARWGGGGGRQDRRSGSPHGIKSPLGNVPAIILGASAVSPLEIAAGYSTLANYGSRVENYLIERIEDAEGNIVYQHRAQRTGSWTPPWRRRWSTRWSRPSPTAPGGTHTSAGPRPARRVPTRTTPTSGSSASFPVHHLGLGRLPR